MPEILGWQVWMDRYRDEPKRLSRIFCSVATAELFAALARRHYPDRRVFVQEMRGLENESLKQRRFS